MSGAIYFHPEGYTTKGPKLMGRHAAGESFLRGLLEYGTGDSFSALVDRPQHGKIFSNAVRDAGRKEPVNIIEKDRLELLADPGVVYYPGPNLGKYAWERSYYGHGEWSLCGITHTTSSAGAMDSIADLLLAPVQPWDALICTSNAVRQHVLKILDAQKAYLKDRLAIRQLILPQLPVIPLGIHTGDFVYSPSQKKAAKQAVGAGSGTHVVMFMGRLSFHAKAHPLAMYLALEKASQQLPAGEEILLIECGWHANDAIVKAYKDAAALACPSVRVITLDGRDPEQRQTAWAAADIFCSLSDNIQETFGIVPIEAMAAGLPVIVSDWDGYKDTVRDGIDGFRIGTMMPPAGLGRDLANRHALEIDNYDMYCGYNCSLVSVDIDATTNAFIQLFASRKLRESMGAAGKERARQLYDWSVIIPQYEELWSKMNRLRVEHAGSQKTLKTPWPARMDPFFGFSHYSTGTLTPETEVLLADDDLDYALMRARQLRQLKMADFAKYVVPSETILEAIIRRVYPGVMAAGKLTSEVSGRNSPRLLRGLVWLLKVGILKLVISPDVKNETEPQSTQKSPLTVIALGLKKQAGVTEARIDHPMSALNALPSVQAKWGSKTISFPKKMSPGVLVLHRQFMIDKNFNATIQRKISQGWVVISDMDDDPHHWKEFVDSDFFAFRGLHAVTVSTEPLAKMMRQWNPNVMVLANGIHKLPKVSSKTPKQGETLRIFFGALNREKDWQPILKGIQAAVTTLQDTVELVVVHDRDFYDAMPADVSKEFQNTLAADDYMALLATCDIALLPLVNDKFNRLKSDLKFIECCAAAVVPVCSPVVYSDREEHLDIGIFASTEKEWREAIISLCKDKGNIKSRRKRGLKYIQQSRLHSLSAPAREAYYRDMLSRQVELESERKQRLSTIINT